MPPVSCTTAYTQQKQTQKGRARLKTWRSSLLVKLAGIHPTSALNSQRLLQLVSFLLSSEKQTKIVEFIWSKMKGKNWKKVLKVCFDVCRLSISSTSSSNMDLPASSKYSNKTSTNSENLMISQPNQVESTRASQSESRPKSSSTSSLMNNYSTTKEPRPNRSRTGWPMSSAQAPTSEASILRWRTPSQPPRDLAMAASILSHSNMDLPPQELEMAWVLVRALWGSCRRKRKELFNSLPKTRKHRLNPNLTSTLCLRRRQKLKNQRLRRNLSTTFRWN